MKTVREKIGKEITMVETKNSMPFSWHRGKPGELLDENRSLVKRVRSMVKAGEREQLIDQLSGWHPADVVELLVHLPLKQAHKLYDWLPIGPAARIIAAINPRLRQVLL